jgi:RNA polymerase sigma-70 factor (ECF subfamily)
LKVIKLHYNEKDLIVAAVKKDRLAQKTIYEKFSPKMLAICNRYVKNIAEAEDVMITSFMKVFTQIQNFENKGSLEGWIRKIMVNDAISFLRTKKQLVYFEEVNTIENFENPAVEWQCEMEVLEKIIENLPIGYQTIFNLHVIEGLKHQEIAKLLNIEEGTSKSQLFMAKKMIKNKIEQQNKIAININTNEKF